MKDKFQYRGATYTALRYAKSHFGKPITVSSTLAIFKHKFGKPSRVRESLDRLTNCGYLVKKQDGWVITYQGSEYLRMTARPFYGEQ